MPAAAPDPTFTITPRGPFSLEEAGRFGFGPRIDPEWDGVLRLAFCTDGYRDQVGVEVRQGKRAVHVVVRTADGRGVELDAVRPGGPGAVAGPRRARVRRGRPA